MLKVLYMPSTPLNILVSAALANARRETDVAELWLIDQKKMDDNPYVKALQYWSESPFRKVSIFSGVAKGREKLQERRDNFERIRQGLSTFHPDVIAVGSDRRVEFQYAMQCMQKQGHQVQGWYLDDGLYTYAGHPQNVIRDGINSMLKKIIYGFWWDEPKNIGMSKWINQAWLFQPEQAISSLRSRDCETLCPEWFIEASIKNLGEVLFSLIEWDVKKMGKLDVVILLPHPNDMAKMQGYTERMTNFIAKCNQDGNKIGLKYHPRAVKVEGIAQDVLEGVTIIPAIMAFEFVLPFLKSGALVVGDVCSAILTTNWLRPDLKVASVLSSDDLYQQTFIETMHRLNLPVYASYSDVNI